jgi:transcriptional regulator with XRE-family HTH domain
MSAIWCAVRMSVRRQAIWQGDRELRRTCARFGEEFRAIRLRAGVSQAAVARAIGVDRSQISRLESGNVDVGNAIRARAAEVLGADFRLQLYAERTPMLHDAAHARLIERLVAIRHPSWRVTLEAPVPGGRRSVDVRLDREGDHVLGEVESHVGRFEEVVRALHGKRDALAPLVPGRLHVLLVLPRTRHHQTIVQNLPLSVRAAFPVESGTLREAIEQGLPWPGDGILWLAGGRQ